MVFQGVHIWLWPKNGWSALDPSRVAADVRDLGLRGVIAHDRFRAASWLYDTRGAKPVDRMKPFLTEGLEVSCGIGRAGGLDDQPQDACAEAIVTALDLPYEPKVMLDWEGGYDRSGGQDKATWIADTVLAQRPKARQRISDCPWWAPLHLPRRPNSSEPVHPTHPRAPYVPFGRLATTDRYVQAYSTDEGGSLRMLGWSRDASQYPAIAARGGVTPWTIRGAFLAYGRTALDVAKTIFAEPDCMLWDYVEMDAETRRGLKIVQKLRAAGYTDHDAVTRFAGEHRIAPADIAHSLGL